MALRALLRDRDYRNTATASRELISRSRSVLIRGLSGTPRRLTNESCRRLFRRLSKCKAPSRYDHVFPGRLASLELVLFKIGKPLGLVGVDALIAAPALELPGVAFEPECVI